MSSDRLSRFGQGGPGAGRRKDYAYEPYGETSTAGGSAPTTHNPWRYTSSYLDSTGFYKMGMRYYRPELMRWSQQDPLEQPTDPGQAMRYGYVGGNPINYADPGGQHYLRCLIGGPCPNNIGRTVGRVGTKAQRALVEYEDRRRNPQQYHRQTYKRTVNQVCGIVTVSGHYAAGGVCYVAGLR